MTELGKSTSCENKKYEIISIQHYIRFKMKNKYRANQMKALLIDWLINNKSIKILASEVPYLSTTRKVDILLIKKNSLHAFEIKSDVDTLNRIKPQIEDYKKTFDCVTVFTTERYIDKISAIIPINVGLLLLRRDDRIENLRHPREQNNIIKANIASFLWRKDILEILRNQHIRFDIKNDISQLRKIMTSHFSLISCPRRSQ